MSEKREYLKVGSYFIVEDIFKNVPDAQLKSLYNQIIAGREEGIRPRCLDEYIRVVQKFYQMDFAEAWRHTEKIFWNEVGKRYFEQMEGDTI